MTRNLCLAIGEDELRVGDHVLTAVLSSGHPMVQRVVADALGSLPAGSPIALRRFAAHLHGALLAETPAADQATRHLHEMRDAYDVTEARD